MIWCFGFFFLWLLVALQIYTLMLDSVQHPDNTFSQFYTSRQCRTRGQQSGCCSTSYIPFRWENKRREKQVCNLMQNIPMPNLSKNRAIRKEFVPLSTYATACLLKKVLSWHIPLTFCLKIRYSYHRAKGVFAYQRVIRITTHTVFESQSLDWSRTIHAR